MFHRLPPTVVKYKENQKFTNMLVEDIIQEMKEMNKV